MSNDRPLKPLGELVENFDSIRVPVKESERRRGPYPYYGASGIVDYVDGYLFDGEYLLIAEDGENLRTRQTPIAFIANGRFWVNNHAHIVRGNSENDTRYLMYALRVADVGAYLTGSAMPKLTQANMNGMPVVAPPLDDQRAIAHVLGSLDDKIELNRRMNRALEAMARTIFKAWFIDFDPVKAKAISATSFPGMPQDIFDQLPGQLTETKLGPIPEGWEHIPIGDLVDVVGGGTPSTKNPEFWEGGKHPFCTPKDMSRLTSPVLLDTERYITQAGVDKISSGQLSVGTVILSSRAPIGYLALTETPVSVNQGIIAMLTGDISNIYLMLWTEANMETIKARAGGSTFAEISKRNFRPIPALRPDSQTLRAFDDVARPLFRMVASNERESRTLAAIRDALLPKLILGEVRLERQPNNDESEQRRLAYHEAGHYVIGYVKGLQVDDIRITGGPAYEKGSASVNWDKATWYAMQTNAAGQEVWIIEYLVASAGHLSQTKVSRSQPDPRDLAADRSRMDAAFVSLLKLSGKRQAALQKELHELARNTVLSAWPQIERLANALLKTGALSREEAVCLISDPDSSQQNKR